jgi:HD-like signal output (HDOD) protein/CheY-like chemotaxis protein
MKVLFIDDEARVLEGLERSMLMVVDDDWELSFVEGGAAALDRLRAEQFDAVVTDMRMPGIDGGEVLRQLIELAPVSARIVLSGQMEDASAVSAFERAHQIISKPCNAEQMVEVLRSAVRHRPLLDRDPFRRAVLAADRLPVAPAIYREIEAELGGDDPSIAKIATIAAKDTGLTARLMHVANSPFYGGGRKLTTSTQAISRLGLRMVATLAAGAVFDKREFPAKTLDLAAVQERALRTAETAARMLPKNAGLASLAGMLSEVGHLVIATSLPALYDAAMREAKATGRPTHEVERCVWGTSHAEVGAYLLSLWGMPVAVVDAVGHHHHCEAFAGHQADPSLSAAVACAAALAGGGLPPEDELAVLGMTLEEAQACASVEVRR